MIRKLRYCCWRSPSRSCLALDVRRQILPSGQPVNLGPVINSPSGEAVECISADGLEMYVSSDRPGGQGQWDLWVARRPTTDADWGPPENLGAVINTAVGDELASISADGLTLYFDSDRPGGYGSSDIWITTRATKNDPWGPPVNMGPKINSSAGDACPCISTDGLELYFGSYRAAGYGRCDIYVARRATQNDPWGDPVNLGPVVNSSNEEIFLSLRQMGSCFSSPISMTVHSVPAAMVVATCG